MTNIIAIVLSAIIQVESHNGLDSRHGDNGRAVGPYQMWVCAVDEANRIEQIYARKFKRKARHWHYSDRHSLKKSRAMCELTMIWHYRRGITDTVKLCCRWRNPYSLDHKEYRRKIRKAVKL